MYYTERFYFRAFLLHTIQRWESKTCLPLTLSTLLRNIIIRGDFLMTTYSLASYQA